MTGGHFQQDAGLIVGGDSLVGSALDMHCRELGIPVEVTSRRPQGSGIFLDLSDPDFTPLQGVNHAFAFICAAVTDMRACQDDPVQARRINVANTIELIRRLADKGTHVVFLSSSQVFDGETPAPDETAPTCPRNEYGAQKLAVEQAIARDGVPAAILRVTKVLAERPVGVFKGWFEDLAAGSPIQAATNMALSPVIVADVARAAARLAARRHHGIWHLSARDEVGYFEAARLMAEVCGLRASLVQGRPLTESEVPAILRPRHATLGSEKIARSLGIPLRGARDVLDGLFVRFPESAAAR
jgi:dTDP-4-dehydrorhamnose reductase